jgi:hypothetical protein
MQLLLFPDQSAEPVRDTRLVEVLGWRIWNVHWGGINHLGGIDGRVTKCRIAGAVCYVRENFAPLGGHFHVSGGERQAFKRGAVSKRHLPVLELCPPPEQWDAIAAIVTRADVLGRPVRKNRLFSHGWAERLFRRTREKTP